MTSWHPTRHPKNHRAHRGTSFDPSASWRPWSLWTRCCAPAEAPSASWAWPSRSCSLSKKGESCNKRKGKKLREAWKWRYNEYNGDVMGYWMGYMYTYKYISWFVTHLTITLTLLVCSDNSQLTQGFYRSPAVSGSHVSRCIEIRDGVGDGPLFWGDLRQMWGSQNASWSTQNHSADWWLTYPSEKYESVGITIPNLWKVIKAY